MTATKTRRRLRAGTHLCLTLLWLWQSTNLIVSFLEFLLHSNSTFVIIVVSQWLNTEKRSFPHRNGGENQNNSLRDETKLTLPWSVFIQGELRNWPKFWIYEVYTEMFSLGACPVPLMVVAKVTPPGDDSNFSSTKTQWLLPTNNCTSLSTALTKNTKLTHSGISRKGAKETPDGTT